MTEYALVVAGGSGSRMKQQTPKQFLPVGGKPILIHTIQQFYNYNPDICMIVVLPENEMETWQNLQSQYGFELPHQLVAGGDTRFQSVKNGLSIIDTEGVVAIHDGVRPFVSTEIIRLSFEIARQKGSAITTVDLKDSIRTVSETGESVALDRKKYKLVQTPQTFQVKDIKRAYQTEESSDLTDDASVAEKAGFKVTLINGSYENIKITTPEDLLMADVLLKNNKGL